MYMELVLISVVASSWVMWKQILRSASSESLYMDSALKTLINLFLTKCSKRGSATKRQHSIATDHRSGWLVIAMYIHI